MRKSLSQGGIFFAAEGPDAPPTKIVVARHGSMYLIRADKWPFGSGPVKEAWCRLASNVRRTIRGMGFINIRRDV